MTQSVNDFLFGGSTTSLSFKNQQPGFGFGQMTVKSFDMVQKRNFDTGKPEEWDDGSPVMQLKIVFDTQMRDQSDPDDKGVRALYVSGGTQQKALGEAIRNAGAAGLAVGGVLSVWLAGFGEAKRLKSGQMGNPPKILGFSYQPPVQAFMAGVAPPNGQQYKWDFGNSGGLVPPQPATVPPVVAAQPAWQPPAPVQQAPLPPRPGQWQPSPAAAQVAQQYGVPVAAPIVSGSGIADPDVAAQYGQLPAGTHFPAPNMGPSGLPTQTQVPAGVHPAQHYAQVATQQPAAAAVQQQPATLSNAAQQAAYPPAVDQQMVQAAVAGMPAVTPEQFAAMSPEQQQALQNLMSSGMVNPQRPPY